MRVRSGRQDQITRFKPEDRSPVEHQLAPPVEHQVHPAELRLGEGDGPGRPEVQMPVTGALEPKLAQHGTQQIHEPPGDGAHRDAR